jgi:Protein of unknown function (DUF2971)
MKSGGEDQQVDQPSRALPENVRDQIKAFHSFGESLVERFVKEVNERPVPKLIYHYTDGAGLRGILESGTLRFGDIFYMNDPSEIRHGIGTAFETLDAVATQAEDQPEHAVFARQFRKLLSSGIEVIAHYFVCCFSKNGDNLDQWRAYADNGRGYSLGFDGPELVNAFSKVCEPHAQTFEITYSDEQLRGMLQDLIELVVPLVSLPRSQHLGEKVSEYMKELQIRLALLALQASIMFKNEAYRHEEEYRLLDMHQFGNVPGVKFRDKPYLLARYREFDWKAVAPGSLKRIIAGPAAESGTGERFAQDCLRAFYRGPSKIEIEKSGIPYRPR